MIISRLTLLSVKMRHTKFVESIETHILDASAKLRKATVTFVTSVCPSYGTTHLPLDGFALNLIYKYSSKLRKEQFKFH